MGLPPPISNFHTTSFCLEFHPRKPAPWGGMDFPVTQTESILVTSGTALREASEFSPRWSESHQRFSAQRLGASPPSLQRCFSSYLCLSVSICVYIY